MDLEPCVNKAAQALSRGDSAPRCVDRYGGLIEIPDHPGSAYTIGETGIELFPGLTGYYISWPVEARSYTTDELIEHGEVVVILVVIWIAGSAIAATIKHWRENRMSEEKSALNYWIESDSSNIGEILYCGKARELFIKFKRGGKVYSYQDCPEDLAIAFRDAESHGKFFHKEIKSLEYKEIA